jgi:hypothetical protein
LGVLEPHPRARRTGSRGSRRMITR